MTTTCYLIGGTSVLTRCADQLVAAGIRIEGIISADRAVAAWAAEHGTPVLDPAGDWQDFLSGKTFDYLLSIVNFRILPASVLAMPQVAAINFHDGPLPRYSGSNVPAWALFEGASRHAATWHLMTESVDAGEVLLEQWFPIRELSTALSLTYETAEVGVELFGRLVPHLLTRSWPEPVNTSGRERRFYLRSDRMAGGGLVHTGTTAIEAARLSKALDYGSFPNPLGVLTLVTDQGAVFSRQARLVARHGERATTMVSAVSASAVKLAARDADLVLSDFIATDGSALSPQAAAQRLGLVPGELMPGVSANRLAAIVDAQHLLRTNEPWWSARLRELRPAPLTVDDFSAATAHYGRSELAFVAQSREEQVCVMSAFLAALAERMGEPCFDVGWSPSRLRSLAEQTMGLAVSRVPIRFDATDPQSLAERLAIAMTRHGYATDLEVRLDVARRPAGSGTPSFTRVMVLEREPGEEASIEPDTEVALLCMPNAAPVVFVRQTAMDHEEALAFAEQVEATALATMLHGHQAAPQVVPAQGAPATIPVEPEPAKPTAPTAPMATVLELVAAVTKKQPDATAVRARDRVISYAELDRWADAIAAHLSNEGVGTGSVVGLMTKRGPELLPAMLGVMRAGAAFLPLDPGFPVERLGRYLTIAECELILTDQRCSQLAGSLGPAIPVPASNGSAMAIPPQVGSSDLAYVLFTSGSTGTPKGVEIEHGALGNFLTGIGDRLGISSDDTVLAHTTVSFDISLLELLLPLTVGGTVVLAESGVARDPAQLAKLIDEVTIAQATPTLWRLLLDSGWTPPAHLTLLAGGEALPVTLAQRLSTSARALWNLYGPTEATIWVSAHRVDSVGTFMPLGQALPNLGMHVLDEKLQHCPPGGIGELYLSGYGLARGYSNAPELTAEVMLTAPETGERMYRTGDEVRLHTDGQIEWLGRRDAQVKIRGNRVEPGEIERVLEEAAGITAAVVVAVPFEGRGEPRLTAYLVAETTVEKQWLDEVIAARLPAYMVPDAYVLIAAIQATRNEPMTTA